MTEAGEPRGWRLEMRFDIVGERVFEPMEVASLSDALFEALHRALPTRFRGTGGGYGCAPVPAQEARQWLEGDSE